VTALGPLADEAPVAQNDSVRVMVPERAGVIMDAARLLDRAGVRADDLTLERPSLDDVFLTLTGRAADVEQPTNETLEVAA
jgi:ABC-2 type transport system ATP-binding protein